MKSRSVSVLLSLAFLQCSFGGAAWAQKSSEESSQESTAAGSQAAPSSAVERCRALMGVDYAGVEITSARIVPFAPPGTVPFNRFTKNTIPVALPEHCRVDGVINRRKGADGVEYGIGFALVLPGNWNGRFLFQGGGGFNGSIVEPLGLFATHEPALAQGFAIVSTDSGHKSDFNFDVSFMRDQQAALDFAFNAVPTVTRVGKDLTAAYFGRSAHHSYIVGCSTGGREGMLAAQRYPDLFDGIVSGAPAMRFGDTRIGGWNTTIAFNRIAPKDADGKPLTGKAFPAEDQKLLSAAVAGQCDALDGLKDGLILNGAACKFDPAVLQCKKGKSADCLSAAQVTAVKTAFRGPRDSQGKPLYAGFPYDLGLLGEHVGNPIGLVPGSVASPFGTPPSPFEFDFADEIRRLAADPRQILSDTASWTDLGTFYRRGGKIIFVHGAADPWFSVLDTQDYVQRSRADTPDFDSSRFYSVPGMGHCATGGLERFDLLSAVVAWVEEDKAPGGIVASDMKLQITRPLCPWPQHGHYKGAGDPKEAASFECRSN